MAATNASMPLVIGFDLSTQSCKGVVYDEQRREFVGEGKVVFDADLPQYATENGWRV
jgi:sugar (pentulose or hexulose) kinase